MMNVGGALWFGQSRCRSNVTTMIEPGVTDYY